MRDPHRPGYRLGIVVSHPIQYYAPWFRHLAAQEELELKVFYLWDSGVTPTEDRKFGQTFSWDLPLLEGYDWEWVKNRSWDPGTHHFMGLINPSLNSRVLAWSPDALLVFGYGWFSQMQLIASPSLGKIPKLLRGDSHHLADGTGSESGLKRHLKSYVYKRIDRFLAVGKANANAYEESGVSPAKITHCPHCVDNERFRSEEAIARDAAAKWRLELGIRPEQQVVLFVGKFESKKRPLDLLHAFLSHEADHEGANSVLLFVGDGELREAIKCEAGVNLNQSVFVAPFQNQSQMAKVYASGDLLVLPSLGPEETWGLAVNEGMNLGLPAIVSSHVGCGPDLVTPGETGWVFQAGIVAELKRFLDEALANPSTLQTMGEAAKKRVELYSYEVATKALVDTLHELIP